MQLEQVEWNLNNLSGSRPILGRPVGVYVLSMMRKWIDHGQSRAKQQTKKNKNRGN